MVFTSFNFLVFFPIVITLYFLFPQKFRSPFLLIASYFFYINTKPVFAVLLGGVTLTTYIFTLLINKTKSEKKKKQLLVADIIIVLLPLVFFKYFNFLNDGLFTLLEYTGLRWPLPNISLLLPVGISFYTFMALGYVIDVYNEEIEAEKNLGIVALFLSFFPIVMSGPIERATNMFHQFKAKLAFNYSMAVNGLQLILWGYFMKLVVADRVGLYVDDVFKNTDSQFGSTLLLASLLQPIRIYADLGGYSLIAMGCAKVIGINIIPNFRRPFFAPTMSELWRRWHISLIKWLTDYVYTPLSFSVRKYGVWGIVTALMLTFIISGVWHGAALGFIVWGAIHGVILSIETLTKKRKDNFEKKYFLNTSKGYFFLNILSTYVLFSFSLIFGAAAISVSAALGIVEKIFTNSFHKPYIDGGTLLYSFIGISLLFIKEFMEEYYPGRVLLFENKNKLIRWGTYYFVLFVIIFFGFFGGEQFVYFKF
jgi:alginate O-acetyltransferase complex protein AlgI